MHIAIGIATAGRRELVVRVIDYMRNQSRPADSVYVCPARDTDYDTAAITQFPAPIHVVKGPGGLPAQRNTIIRHALDADVIVFFDDDFLPDPHFLAELESLFTRQPGLAMATGDVVADGAKGPGIEFEDATADVERLPALPAEQTEAVFNAYGCNMAVRLDLARQNQIAFDEVLPLYGWWEDVDFSRRLAPFGTIIKSNRLRGVHMGSKSGRTPGVRLGYSQVINIAYMIRKGSIPLGVGLRRIAMNLLANSIRQFAPEPWFDRRGRFIGNIKALMDWLAGRVDPQKILEL